MDRICVVHGGIDESTSLNRIAKVVVTRALERSIHVTAVCLRLDPSLQPDCEWIVPPSLPRIHLLQWLADAATVPRVIRKRRYDAVLGWQAQLLPVLTAYNCAFLSYASKAHGGFTPMNGPRPTVQRVQQEAVRGLEDLYFRRWPNDTRMIYTSGLIKEAFEARYPKPPHQMVLPNPGPPTRPVTSYGRRQSRSSFGLDPESAVFAYLGGDDTRKGPDRVVAAARCLPNAHFLWAGPATASRDGELPPNIHRLGHLLDPSDVLEAADALLVPSRFEPYGVVCLEAAARGVPSIVTPAVGAAADGAQFGAVIEWAYDAPFSLIVEAMRPRAEDLRRGALAWSERRQAGGFADSVLDLLLGDRGAMSQVSAACPVMERGG